MGVMKQIDIEIQNSRALQYFSSLITNVGLRITKVESRVERLFELFANLNEAVSKLEKEA